MGENHAESIGIFSSGISSPLSQGNCAAALPADVRLSRADFLEIKRQRRAVSDLSVCAGFPPSGADLPENKNKSTYSGKTWTAFLFG